LRAIFGPTNENWEWRIKYSNELYTLYKESDRVTYIKVNRLRWAGHVIQLEEQSPATRVLVAVVEGKRQRGRPKLRWEDGVMDDARKLGEKNWRNVARLAEASEEGLGSNWAVVPMMMMMISACLIVIYFPDLSSFNHSFYKQRENNSHFKAPGLFPW
jgi:hypothetical protein